MQSLLSTVQLDDKPRLNLLHKSSSVVLPTQHNYPLLFYIVPHIPQSLFCLNLLSAVCSSIISILSAVHCNIIDVDVTYRPLSPYERATYYTNCSAHLPYCIGYMDADVRVYVHILARNEMLVKTYTNKLNWL